jgi:hypothetical protein
MIHMSLPMEKIPQISNSQFDVSAEASLHVRDVGSNHCTAALAEEKGTRQ